VEEIFACIDSDRSGSVSFHEFSTWWTSHGGAGSLLELAKRAFDLVAQRDGTPGVNIHGLKDIMIAVASDSWEQATDPASGRQYFVNPASGASSWLAPGIDAVGPFLERAGISRDASTVTVYTPSLTEIFDEIDENGSGEIDFEEFADWWERNGGSQVSLAMAQEAFGLIEMRDGMRGLSFDELKEVVIAIASDDWEEAFDQATGRKYFIDPHSKSTTWLVPGVEIVGPFLERVGITRNGVRPAVRTRFAARGPTSRTQTVGMRPLPTEHRHVEPTAAPPVAKKPSGDGRALVHASMVDRAIATLDIADTGQILQTTFVTWWADHQAPGLPVMDKLNFSRPISKEFVANGGALSTMQFRELLGAMFEKETAKSSDATELNADHMNAWLQRLLQF
jgi:Ca2+-binding EF-hand superfamily protein